MVPKRKGEEVLFCRGRIVANNIDRDAVLTDRVPIGDLGRRSSAVIHLATNGRNLESTSSLSLFSQYRLAY